MLALLLASVLAVGPANCYQDTPLGSVMVQTAGVPRVTFRGQSIDGHGFEDMHPSAPAQFPMLCDATLTVRACGVERDIASDVHVWRVSVGPWDRVLDYGGTSGAWLDHVQVFGAAFDWPEVGACLSRGAPVEALCTSHLSLMPGVGAWALASRMRVAGRLTVE